MKRLTAALLRSMGETAAAADARLWVVRTRLAPTPTAPLTKARRVNMGHISPLTTATMPLLSYQTGKAKDSCSVSISPGILRALVEDHEPVRVTHTTHTSMR